MVTCLYGALVMSVQTDIKRQLAYSTVSQMGFMILQCGLGSFHIAALHIVGHSFYKAYAFLNSGTAVQLAKIQSFSLSGTYTLPSYWGQCLSLVMGISIVLVLIVITGTQTIDTPGSILLYIVLTLALAQTLLSTAKIILGLQYACLIGVSYVGLHHLWHAGLGTILPESSVGLTTLQTVVIFSCGCAFFTLYLIQNNSSRFLHTRWGNALYVHLINRSYSGR
jgi:NAD(P)H-quinone oxidoreductase subunit 5